MACDNSGGDVFSSANNILTGSNAFSGQVEFSDSTMLVNGTGIKIGTDTDTSSTSLVQVQRNYNTADLRVGLASRLQNSGSGTLYANLAHAEALTPGRAGRE